MSRPWCITELLSKVRFTRRPLDKSGLRISRRRNSSYRLILLIICGASITWCTAAAREPSSVPPVRPLLKAAGLRLGIGTTDEGPGLVLFDRNGRTRVLFGATRRGPGLAFFDEEGRVRVWSGFRGGGAVLSFSDVQRVPRVILKLKILASSVATYSTSGRVRSAIVVAGNRSGLGLFAQTGLPRLAVALGKYVPVVALFDDVGRIIQEPLYHALPGLFAEMVKSAASLWQRLARQAQARETAVSDPI